MVVIVLLLGLAAPSLAQETRAPADDSSGETYPEGYPAERWLPATDLENASPVLDERRRAVPDYDGRPDKRTAADVAIWIPRVVFYPVHLVTEYVLRRPLVGLVTWLERHDIIARAANAVSFGTRGRVGMIPTAWVDFGIQPSVGVYLWANNVPTDDDRFALHFAWGGERWWRLSVRETVPFDSPFAADERGDVRLHLLYDARPDHRLRTIHDRDAAFNVIIGAGTDTFAAGGRIEDLRAVFGFSRGTSTRSTRCPTRAGSRIGSDTVASRSRTPLAARARTTGSTPPSARGRSSRPSRTGRTPGSPSSTPTGVAG